MKIIKRVDGEPPEEKEFMTLKELLDVKFVKEFTEMESFQRFSFHTLPENRAFLMSEHSKGTAHWVAGTISDFDNKELNLPEWHTARLK